MAKHIVLTLLCTCNLPLHATRKKHLRPETPEEQLSKEKCGKSEILMAAGASLQVWLREQMGLWRSEINSKKLDIEKRAEGNASMRVLRSLATEIPDTELCALFNRGAGGVLTMQALALVEIEDEQVEIAAIVSHNSLFRDAFSLRGAGRSLIAGILNYVHQKAPTKSLVIKGSPGDSFVERVYKQHGMQEVGKSEYSNLPNLELQVPSTCTDFMHSILCDDLSAKHYMSAAWRLMPYSSKLYDTCAHMMPRELFIQKIRKLLKYAA